MRQQWAYRVTVSTRDNDLEYEGRFVSLDYARKMVQRKMEQYRDKDALVCLYDRWDGTCMTYVS